MRSPGAGGILGQFFNRWSGAALQYRRQEGPGGFDLVTAGKEGRITQDRVEQQAFVGFGRGPAKSGGITEVHFQRPNAHLGTGGFNLKLQRYSFIGLNAYSQQIRQERFAGIGVEQNLGYSFKMDVDFGDSDRQAFSGAEIKRNTGPAPIVDEDLQGGESFGEGILGDALFLEIAADVLSVNLTGGILGPSHVITDAFAGHRPEGLEEFDLFVVDGIGMQRNGWFHGHQAEQMHHVILDDVAQGAGLVIVGAAFFDADIFEDGNLDVVDVMVIPEGLEDAVGKAENKQVLDRFLAQIMVDTKDLFFVKELIDFFIKSTGGLEVPAERFFNDDARPG